MSTFEAAHDRLEAVFVPAPLGSGHGFRPAGETHEARRDESPRDAASVAASKADADSSERASEAQLRAAYERGLADGRVQGEAEIEGAVSALGAATGELAEQRAGYLRAQRKLVVELALSMARRILEREIETDPDLLMRFVESAIDDLEGDAPVVVQLSRTDYGRATNGPDAGLTEVFGASVRFEPAPELADGEVRVVSGATTIEAGAASMLVRFEEALAGLETIASDSSAGGDAS